MNLSLNLATNGIKKKLKQQKVYFITFLNFININKKIISYFFFELKEHFFDN